MVCLQRNNIFSSPPFVSIHATRSAQLLPHNTVTLNCVFIAMEEVRLPRLSPPCLSQCVERGQHLPWPSRRLDQQSIFVSLLQKKKEKSRSILKSSTYPNKTNKHVQNSYITVMIVWTSNTFKHNNMLPNWIRHITIKQQEFCMYPVLSLQILWSPRGSRHQIIDFEPVSPKTFFDVLNGWLKATNWDS